MIAIIAATTAVMIAATTAAMTVVAMSAAISVVVNVMEMVVEMIGKISFSCMLHHSLLAQRLASESIPRLIYKVR